MITAALMAGVREGSSFFLSSIFLPCILGSAFGVAAPRRGEPLKAGPGVRERHPPA